MSTAERSSDERTGLNNAYSDIDPPVDGHLQTSGRVYIVGRMINEKT